ncbi:MAG: hypothetical protein LUC37_06035 [Prevotella sp.]|nr:hypothetical protein [Prevotella sp.]
MKYLINTTETYRVDTESEVDEFIKESKEARLGSLTKYSSTYKEQKVKGEVVDAWYRVTLYKSFNLEKEPEREVEVAYE